MTVIKNAKQDAVQITHFSPSRHRPVAAIHNNKCSDLTAEGLLKQPRPTHKQKPQGATCHWLQRSPAQLLLLPPRKDCHKLSLRCGLSRMLRWATACLLIWYEPLLSRVHPAGRYGCSCCSALVSSTAGTPWHGMAHHVTGYGTKSSTTCVPERVNCMRQKGWRRMHAFQHHCLHMSFLKLSIQLKALPGLPVLVEQAGSVLFLRLCTVACQELTQEALPSGLALSPQVSEDLRRLILRLRDRRMHHKHGGSSSTQVRRSGTACSAFIAVVLHAACLITAAATGT